MAFGMNFFRKYQGRLLLVVAVMLMVTWFVGGALMRLLIPEGGAGTMFGEKVSMEQFQDAAAVMSVLRNDTRPSDDDIWRFLVLLHEADKLGIKVTSSEITEGLRQWVMQLTGATDQNVDNAYKMVLTRLRTTDEMARWAISQHLRISKLLQMVAGARTVTDAEAWQSYVEDRVSLKVKSLKVMVKDFTATVTAPDDAALLAYYDAHKATYTVPAMATIEYVAAMRSDFGKLFAVTDEEISQYYDERKTEDYLLSVSTEAKLSEEAGSTESSVSSQAPSTASEIAAPSGSTEPQLAAELASTAGQLADESIYKPLAEVAGEIRTKLEDQKAKTAIIGVQVDAVQQKDVPLQKTAENYGLPFATAGPFSSTEKDKLDGLSDALTGEKVAVIDQVFSGRQADIVYAEGPAGYFVYRVTSLEPEKQPLLDEVKDRVLSNYTKAESEKLATAEGARILDALKANGWDAYAKDPKYDVTEMAVDVSKYPELFKAAARTRQGAFGGPVLMVDSVYAFQVTERVEPKFAEYESMKVFVKLYRFMGDKQAFVTKWEDNLVQLADVKAATNVRAAGSHAPASLPYY